jgi:hypothetical protein
MTARIQLPRAKGSRMPVDTVKVDRATRWGNPWKVGAPGEVRFHLLGALRTQPVTANLTATEAVDAYVCWLIGYAIPRNLRPAYVSQSGDRAFWDHMAARRRTIFSHIHMLRGKDLACWCKPGATCHADVLLALANCDPRQMTDTLQQMRTT